MLGSVRKWRLKTGLVGTAVQMLENGAFAWTTRVGTRVAHSLLADLVETYGHELDEHRRLIKERYPPTVLNTAGVIALATFLLRDSAEFQELAEELLLVSALALHQAFDAGHPDAAQVLASEIDTVARVHAPVLYQDICPVAF